MDDLSNSTQVFQRGQIWRWNDPDYGDKAEGQRIKVSDARLRYNRYAIIIQSTETIRMDQPILVIPCTSSHHYDSDVTLRINGLPKYKTQERSFAAVLKITPAHPSTLLTEDNHGRGYICTCSPQLMREIDAQLIKLVLPTITNYMSSSEIMERFGIDMNLGNPVVELTVKESNDEIKNTLQSLISNAPTKKVTSEPKPVVHDTKPKQFKRNEVFYSCECGNTNSLNADPNTNCCVCKTPVVYPHKGSIDPKVFDILDKPDDKPKAEVKEEPKKEEVKQEKKPNNKHIMWSVAKIYEFISYYNKNGKEATAKEFGLSPQYVSRCYGLWRDGVRKGELSFKSPSGVPISATKEEAAMPSKDPEPVEPNQETKAVGGVVINHTMITTFGIPAAISTLSNVIRDFTKEQNLYSLSSRYEKDIKRHLSEDEFYDNISSGCYYSMIDVLHLNRQKSSNSITCPPIDYNTKDLGTWFFLNKLTEDPSLDPKKDAAVIMQTYRTKYCVPNGGVTKSFIKRLRIQLNNRLNLMKPAVEEICTRIDHVFSER